MRYITIGGTFVCALGIGYFMQNAAGQNDPAAPVSDAVARAEFKPLSESILPTGSGVEVSALATIPQDPASMRMPSAAPFDVASLVDSPAEAGFDPSAAACAVTANAAVEAGAMVRFSVSAPCFPNERAVIHHNGMMFTDVTNDAGEIETMVPALSEQAFMMVEFASGDGAVASVTVSSLMFYDRVVLQWSGSTGLQLHAREYGAEYGADGHVWSGATRDVSAAALGEGGFITLLGDADTLAPRMAEVYTFPTGTASRAGDIDLSVEAEVTAQNCGQDIEGQAIEVNAAERVRTQYLTLAVPDCTTIGDFLVLNNLVDDLKIALN